jgi:hypothetical protein
LSLLVGHPRASRRVGHLRQERAGVHSRESIEPLSLLSLLSPSLLRAIEAI